MVGICNEKKFINEREDENVVGKRREKKKREIRLVSLLQRKRDRFRNCSRKKQVRGTRHLATSFNFAFVFFSP